MATASSLIRSEIRRVSSEASKALGRLTKIAGSLNGGRGGGVSFNGGITVSRVPIGGFPGPQVPGGFPRPRPPAPRPRPPIGPTLPLTPGGDPFAPGPGQPGGGLGGLCALIPDERLRILCQAGVDVFGDGGGAGPGRERFVGDEGCPAGTISFEGTCIDASKFLPGGDPLFFPSNGAVVQGGFGLPATTPGVVTRDTRKCPKGMVLGIDDLCYAKAILPARSKLRKWRRPPRPPITRRDTVAIRRAAGARDRVFELAKDVGLHVAKAPHRRKKK